MSTAAFPTGKASSASTNPESGASSEEILEFAIDDQKERWQRGERVPAEAYLGLHPILAEPPLCVELVYAEVMLRESAGDTPQCSEYCFRFPLLADRIRSLFQIHRALVNIPLTADAPRAAPDVLGSAPSSSATPSDKPALNLPGFDVHEVIGRGGMAIVYKARHLQLGRTVAIKMLPPEGFPGESASRLLKEAEAIARVQHPNVVQVFEVGTWQEMPYLVLEFVEGGNLADQLRSGPLAPAEAARLIQTVATAVHHFHTLGVIHRDLKPRNILMQKTDAADGVPRALVPKVTDFGLAKHLGQNGLSHTGELIGTPNYMAPEQAAGQKGVGPAADIYSLGAILYECLTGRPPFQGETLLAIMGQIAHVDPAPASQVRDGVPLDLETVCLKCLSKSPKARYATAQHLADDLNRFLNGKPTLARPLGLAGRTFKMVRRYPVITGLLGLVGVTLFGGLISALLLWQRAVTARNDLQTALNEVQIQHSQAETSLYFGRIAQSVLLWDAGDAEQARELLASYEPAPGQPDLRGWEWRYLQRLFHPEVKVRRFPFWVNGLALLPVSPGRPDDALAVAVGVPLWTPQSRPLPEDGQAGFLRFDDSSPFVNSGAPLPGGCLALAVQVDGSRVAWGTSSGHVIVMDRVSGRHISTIALNSPVTCLHFEAGADRLISSHRDGRLRVVNPTTGAMIKEIDAHIEADCVFAVNPAGTLLVCGGHADNLQFFELPTWKPIGVPVRHPSDVISLAFSPDGATFLSGGEHGTIVVWDASSRQEIRRLEDHSGPVYAIAFHQNGKMFASGGADRVVRLWDISVAKPIRLYRGHSATVRSLTFSRDGRRLASGSQDQTLRMWDAGADPRGVTLPFRDRLNAIAFDETQSTLAIRADDIGGTVAAWSIPRGEQINQFDLPPQGREVYPVRYADFLNRGRALVAISQADPRTMTFVDAATGQRLQRSIAIHGAIQTLAADSSGRWLVWAESEVGNEVLIRRWDEETQQESEPIRLNVPAIRSLAFDPAHGRIAAAVILPTPESGMAVWIVDTNGRERPRELCRTAILFGGLAFTTRADLLAAAVNDNIFIYRTDTWELQHRVPGLVSITNIAFSADGRRLAAVGYDGVVTLADPATGTRVLQLRSLVPNRPEDRACDARVAFSADGNWMASSTWNGTLIIWDGSPLVPASYPFMNKR